jgi:hypothetical protein
MFFFIFLLVEAVPMLYGSDGSYRMANDPGIGGFDPRGTLSTILFSNGSEGILNFLVLFALPGQPWMDKNISQHDKDRALPVYHFLPG